MLFKYDVDYGDLKPGVGDSFESEGGAVVLIKEMDGNLITECELLYINIRPEDPSDTGGYISFNVRNAPGYIIDL